MRFGVIVFPGSNCDHDAFYAVSANLGQKAEFIWHDSTSLGDVEISGVRLVDHLKGPAWLTCLKVDAGGTAQHYAVFIQGDKVIDWRGGIVIDQCHKETYTPLATATVAKKPGS